MKDEIESREKLRDRQLGKARALERLQQRDPTNVQRIVSICRCSKGLQCTYEKVEWPSHPLSFPS